MSPTFSVIVPAFNEAQVLAGNFKQQGHLFSPDVELLIVDGGSGDATAMEAIQWTPRVFRSAKGRAHQMNFAALHARGDYLIFLHADTVILPQAWEELAANLKNYQPAWGFFPIRLDGKHPLFRIVEWCISCRSRLTWVATGDQAIFVKQSLFQQLGGYKDQPLMEDVDLAKRLRKEAKPLVLSHPVLTSSRRWQGHGIFTTILKMWFIRLAYYLGMPAERLASWY